MKFGIIFTATALFTAIALAAPATAQSGGYHGNNGYNHNSGYDNQRGHNTQGYRGRPSGDTPLGRVNFNGHDTREVLVSGGMGRNVDRVLFQPVDGNLRCDRITAVYDNGSRRRLDINANTEMVRDHLYQYRLSDYPHALAAVNMACFSTTGRSASAEVSLRR